MQQPSIRKEIIQTAVVTLAALVLASLMIAVIVFFAFPYRGYKFSSELGMDRTALLCAERYAGQGNVDGFVYCIELDEQLLNDSGKDKYALKLIAHTEQMLKCENVDGYFAQLDEYYLTNAPKQTRIGLYSYYEYVVSSNYVARAIVDKEDQMIFRGQPTALNDLFVSDITATEKAIIYCALSKALKQGEVNYELFVSGGNFTDFYYSLHSSVAPMIVSIEGETDQLKALFLMRSALYLVDEVVSFFESREVDVSADWDGFLDYQYNGKDLNSAYTDMFLDYIIND